MSNHEPRRRAGFQARSMAMVFLLVLAVLTAAPPAFPMAGPHPAPAGCPEHARHAPRPEPVSYQCCQTGHNAAVLQNAPSVRPLFYVSRSLASEACLFVAVGHNDFCQLLTSSTSPPGSTPLRV